MIHMTVPCLPSTLQHRSTYHELDKVLTEQCQSSWCLHFPSFYLYLCIPRQVFSPELRSILSSDCVYGEDCLQQSTTRQLCSQEDARNMGARLEIMSVLYCPEFPGGRWAAVAEVRSHIVNRELRSRSSKNYRLQLGIGSPLESSHDLRSLPWTPKAESCGM